MDYIMLLYSDIRYAVSDTFVSRLSRAVGAPDKATPALLNCPEVFALMATLRLDRAHICDVCARACLQL